MGEIIKVTLQWAQFPYVMPYQEIFASRQRKPLHLLVDKIHANSVEVYVFENCCRCIFEVKLNFISSSSLKYKTYQTVGFQYAFQCKNNTNGQ